MTQIETRSPVIAIEGAIGAGKTTLCRYIRRNLDAIVIDEAESALLTEYIEEPRRWSFAVQTDLLIKRCAALRVAHQKARRKECPIFLDRSIVGDRAFARANWRQNRMNAAEYAIWCDLYDELMQYTAPPDIVVYLDVSVEKALQRSIQRDQWTREREYILELSRTHEEALEDLKSHGTYIMRVDWNEDLEKGAYAVAVDWLISKLMCEYNGALLP